MYDAFISETTTYKAKHFYRTWEKDFKECYNSHVAPFRNKSKEKSTELSKFFWDLKEKCLRLIGKYLCRLDHMFAVQEDETFDYQKN